VIHDRYRQRLFAYTRQMLAHRQDAEDALQDIFVRAYAGLRANDRELALRAWLYRVAHNRCIDELRRPSPPPPEVLELLRSPVHDPIAEADQRESLRRLIADVRRLPDQQRSALLMRELGGMSYADMAGVLGVTVPAVKSLLVRARLALAQALEARDTACSDIREELILSHDRGLRPGAMARRHMRDCDGCREFRHQLRGVSRRFAAIVPTLGPLGVLANLLGVGGAGSGAAGGAAGGGSAVVGTGSAVVGTGSAVVGTGSAVVGTGSAVVGVGAISAGATHVATLLAAAMVTAGGAVELQHTITAPATHHHLRARPPIVAPATRHVAQPVGSAAAPLSVIRRVQAAPAAVTPAPSAHPRVAPARPAQTSAVPTTVTTSTTTVTLPAMPKTRPTGGSSTMIAGGGTTPTSTSPTHKKPTDTSSLMGSSVGSTTSTTSAPTQQPTDASSTTQPSSTTSGGSTTSGTSGGTGSSTGSTTGTGSSTGSTTGTGSSPETPLGWSPPPAP
jgi:RNA polymerase sigma factor (sigma-70 family)